MAGGLSRTRSLQGPDPHGPPNRNYDVRIAATRNLAGSGPGRHPLAPDQLPTISGGVEGSQSAARARSKFFSCCSKRGSNQVDLSLAWELDFWGEISPSQRVGAEQISWQRKWARQACHQHTSSSDVCRSLFPAFVSSTWKLEISRRNSGLAPRFAAAQHKNVGKAGGGHVPCSMFRQAEQFGVSPAAENQFPIWNDEIERSRENFPKPTLLGKTNPGPIHTLERS